MLIKMCSEFINHGTQLSPTQAAFKGQKYFNE